MPHSFSIPYFPGSGFYVGYGWYRKTIDLPETWKEKQVSLEFDGVFQDAEIYVNGKQAGRRTRIFDRPTAASSAAPGHSSRIANDGDQTTYWQAAASGAGAVWTVDLENMYDVRGVEIAPPSPDEMAFVVEASLDGAVWRTVGAGKGAQASYTLTDFAAPIKARSLRVP